MLYRVTDNMNVQAVNHVRLDRNSDSGEDTFMNVSRTSLILSKGGLTAMEIGSRRVDRKGFSDSKRSGHGLDRGHISSFRSKGGKTTMAI